MIRITSKKEGFRRCGVAHGAAPKDWPDDRFSAAELQRLKAEPMLVVQVLPDPEPEAEDPESMTVAQLTDALNELKVEIPAGSKKADLVALYQKAVEG